MSFFDVPSWGCFHEKPPRAPTAFGTAVGKGAQSKIEHVCSHFGPPRYRSDGAALGVLVSGLGGLRAPRQTPRAVGASA